MTHFHTNFKNKIKIGTSKGSICAYSFPLNRHSQLELVDTVETGLEDMKIVAGNKHIYAISKKSCLVSVSNKKKKKKKKKF